MLKDRMWTEIEWLKTRFSGWLFWTQ